FDARRAGGLAIVASHAAVEMQQGLMGRLFAFQHQLHLVDAATRAVEFVPGEQEGWAGREAETAVRAAAQDPVGLAAVIRVACPVSESSLHDRSSKWPLPDDRNAGVADSSGCRDGTCARQNACVIRWG